jgi:hypothetical protein
MSLLLRVCLPGSSARTASRSLLAVSVTLVRQVRSRVALQLGTLSAAVVVRRSLGSGQQWAHEALWGVGMQLCRAIALPVCLAAGAATSCGGSVATAGLDSGSGLTPTTDGDDDSPSAQVLDGEVAADASSDAGPADDADDGATVPQPAVDDGSVACTSQGTSVGSGAGGCTTVMQWACGGSAYAVTCSCPSATCGCVGPGTSRVLQFASCPTCPGMTPQSALDLFNLCFAQ